MSTLLLPLPSAASADHETVLPHGRICRLVVVVVVLGVPCPGRPLLPLACLEGSPLLLACLPRHGHGARREDDRKMPGPSKAKESPGQAHHGHARRRRPGRQDHHCSVWRQRRCVLFSACPSRPKLAIDDAEAGSRRLAWALIGRALAAGDLVERGRKRSWWCCCGGGVGSWYIKWCVCAQGHGWVKEAPGALLTSPLDGVMMQKQRMRERSLLLYFTLLPVPPTRAFVCVFCSSVEGARRHIQKRCLFECRVVCLSWHQQLQLPLQVLPPRGRKRHVQSSISGLHAPL